MSKFAAKYQQLWFPKVGDIVYIKGWYPPNAVNSFAKVIEVHEDNHITIKFANDFTGYTRKVNRDQVMYHGRQYPAWVLDKISRGTKF